LRKEIQASQKVEPIVGVDSALANRSADGLHLAAKTRTGKLKVSGLTQIWFQSVANDNDGIVRNPPAGDLSESNAGNDNDTFRIRRAEINFDFEITENISARVSIDPARESAPLFYPLPTLAVHNRSSGLNGRFYPAFNTFSAIQPAENPAAMANIPRLLQDAYLQFDRVAPHHDFRIGQFLPPAGEESWRNNGELDFAERSMGGFLDHVRDLGLMIHGSWWDERFQYWAGVFNGPDGSVLSDPDIVPGGNRSDDNDEKNIAWRLAVRPVWNEDRWFGRLELGYARTDGWTGEAGQGYDASSAINGTNIELTAINKQSAWGWYRPGGAARGWWLRGEWNSQRGRHSAFFGRTNLLGIGADATTDASGVTVVRGQLVPAPVTTSGWHAAMGYKLSDSIFGERLRRGGAASRALERMEFAVRYEAFENIAMEGLVDSDRSVDQFKTRVFTTGINYALSPRNTRLQANYLWVDEATDRHPDRGLREVRNNVFVLNFQVGF